MNVNMSKRERRTTHSAWRHWLVACMSVAVAALVLGGCQGDVVLVDDGDVMGEGGNTTRAIGFDNTFIARAASTRAAAPVALSDYTSSMGVWGWRSDDTTTDQPQFLDQLVAYDPAANKWQYNPLRYWERQSTYRFYAYAPHQSDAPAAVTIDPATGHISVAGVTLAGTNLQMPPTTSQQYVFPVAASGSDIDWMVARAGRTNVAGRLGQTVEFTMQHILSKLNVAVRIRDALAADAGVTGVTVESLTIGTFHAEGDFAQVLDHTPDADVASDRATVEWALTDATPALTLHAASNVVVKGETNPTNTLLYILESLVLPQAVTDSQTVKLCYTLTFSDGRTERYTYMMPFSDAFGSTTAAGGQLLSGYSYTLRFTIAPDVITFDPSVNDWIYDY